MSTTIDQRVVEMQFDNKQFESNVSTTMSSIEKLKQSLNFTGASKGLENVNEAAKKCDMSVLGGAVETVGLKFNAMYTIADQALRNITNSAMAAGKRIISALTIDPVKTGFSEYETQMNAVQTILANTESKGKTLDDVNGALDELNAYADKTIYNFTEMTRNIGTFTAAGVDLDTSVSAIKGIANLAAVSGSNSQQASTAMYQLSQAMASGTVKLMDWNSVVNAGMGGQVFQDALKETARVHGIAIDDIINKNGSFRESLQEGWLTTEILTDTLAKFTGDLSEEQLKSMGYTEKQIEEIMKLGKTANDAATKVKTFTQLFDTLKEAAQSGWTQTWEILVGDFEEAKELLTNISDVVGGFIGKSAEARNELLENWKVMGGRQDLIDSFKNIFEGIISIVKPIKEAFREIFPPTTAEQLVGITKGLKEFTSKLKLSDTASENLKRTFKGLFAVLDIIKQVFSAVFKAVGSLFGSFGELGGGILGATASLGDWLVGLSEFIKSSGILNKVCQGIADVIKAAFKGVSSFVKFIKTKFVTPGLEALKALLENIQGGMSGVGEAAGGMKGLVVTAFENISSALESCSFVKILKGIWNVIKIIGSGIAKVFGALTSGLIDVLGNADFNGILGIVNSLVSGGLLVSIVKFIKSFATPLEDLKDSVDGFLGNVKEIFGSVGDCLKGFQDKLKADALKSIAIAVAILAAALILLSFIDTERLISATGAITALFAELIVAMGFLGKIQSPKGVLGVSTTLMTLSSSLLILSVAMKIISTMSLEEMGIGLLGIGAGLAALVIAVNLLPEKKVKNAAASIKKMASALLILSLGLKIMSTMSWEEMSIGLVTTVVSLAALVAAANLLPKDMALRSLGIISLATALLIMSGALKIMSTMSWDEMNVGLTALAGTMAILVVSLNLMKRALPGAAAMFIVAPALVILASALRIMGTMSLDQIGNGLTALGGAMVILAIGLNLMRKTVAGSAAMLIAAGALAILAPVLITLGLVSAKTIAQGLLAIAGAFTVIGVAGLLLKPLIPTIIALSGAMVMIGVGVLAAGVGLVAFGTGLTAIAVGFTAVAAALPAIVTGIVGIVSAFIRGIGEGIVAFCEVIARGAPAIGEAIKALVLTICDVLVECVPVIADTLLKIVLGLLDALVQYTPQIVDSLFAFVIGILNGIAANMPELIQAVANIFMSIFVGAVDALASMDTGALIEGLAAVGLMAAVVAALAAIAPLIPMAMVGAVGMGVVVAELAAVLSAIGLLAQIPGLKWLVGEGGNFLRILGNAIGQFIGGILGGIAEGFMSSLPQIGTDLSTFMTNLKPFIDGAKSIDESVVNGVKSLVDVILSITGASILEGIVSFVTGGSSITMFAEELPKLGKGLKGFSDATSGIVPENVTAAANAAKVLAEMTNAIPNSGGIVSWFAGDNSISKFANELPILGKGLKGFSDAVVGIVPENVTAAANAAKTLAQMTSSIPNEGGVVSWFSGDNSVSKFASEITTLGKGLKGFSDATVGVVPENVTAAANAAKALADMTAAIPDQGGIVSWFAGDQSISKFASDLPKLGKGLKGFSDATAGINPETMTAAANAAKSLAELTKAIPNQNGIVSWFTGEQSLSKFAGELPKLGKGLKGFSDSTSGVNPENMTASANAAKALAEMTKHIPTEGGIKAWFTGETNVANFAEKLPSLGKGLKGFSDSVAGINPENVTAASNAAKSLAQMTETVPKETGKIITFGENLTKFGTSLASYFKNTSGISSKSISGSSSAISAVKDIVAIDSGKISSISKAIDDMVKSIKNLANVPKNSTKDFIKALGDLGKKSAKAFVEAFDGIDKDLKKKAQKAMDSFIEGVNDRKSKAKKAFTNIVEECVDAVSNKSSSFKTAGKNLAQGLADGISANSYKAEAKAKAMAEAAAKAAKEALDINSPSKVFRAIGYSIPEGLAMGIDKFKGTVIDSAVSMADGSVDGVKSTISRIADAINSDIDAQPTIRPVLDLSDVKSGANSLGRMLDFNSAVGVNANVGAINAMMAQRGQNGANDDVVSAIKDLAKDIGNNRGDTYNFGNVSYDDDSSIAAAVRELVRAAKVERRV